MKFTSIIAFAFVCFLHTMKAQLSGNYLVPGNYSSIAAAISALNTQGVSGPVNILVSTGWSEVAPVGGFSLTASGSATAPITFQRNGTGNNPLVYAYSGGTATPGSAQQDGIWRFIGSDYITIDGINLTDTNSFNPATMEFGFGFFKASATNGCQNNTIKNCVVSLNRANNATGNATAVDGSRGIEFVNALSNAHTTPLTITSPSGSNSNNTIHSNIIQQCNIGIALIGFLDASPYANADTGNDVGGASTATGNSILNFGGGGTTSPSAGIRTLGQYNFNASFNTINNNNGSGAAHASTLRGIYVNTAAAANTSINNNTVTLHFGGTTSQMSVIENVSGATGTTNSVSISNNVITNCTNLSTSTGIFYGIYNNGASSSTLTISNNTFTNNISNSPSGTNYLIFNNGAVSSRINLTNNALSCNYTGPTGYSGTMYNIYNTNGTTSTSLTITGNTFSNYNHVNTGTGAIYYIYNTSSMSSFNLSNNLWSGLTLNNSGANYFLYNGSSTQNQLTVTNNTITNINRIAAAGSMYCYYALSSALPVCVQTFSGNLISNITATVAGTGVFYGFYNTDGATSPYPRKLIFNNEVSNITTASSGAFYGFYTSYLGDGSGSNGSAIFNNRVENISTAGLQTGIHTTALSSPNYPVAVHNNTIANLQSSTGTSTVTGAQILSSGAGINVYKNKIYNISNTGASGTAHGILASTSPSTTIYNNLVGNISAPNSGAGLRVNGIHINAGTVNLFYNTVYLNTSSSGSDFSSSAVFSATAAIVRFNNNVFVNLSSSTGTGVTTAYRRSGTAIANHSTASDRNLYYAGSPGPSNLIYTDGVNNYQTLSTFVSAFAPAEANSVTENPVFQSVTGSNTNFLNINTASPTQIESKGQPIAGIADDYAGTTRNASTPDLGAWEGNYTPVLNDIVAPTFLADGFIGSVCNLSSRIYTINITDVSGVAGGTLSPRVYYSLNGAPYTSVPGTMISGNSTNGVWSFTLTYAGSVNDVVSYFVVAQDIASPSNLGAIPGGGFSGTSVNNVTSNPSNPYTYTLNMSLGGTYTVGAGGTFTTLTQAANAYNIACLTGSVTYVLTDAIYSANESFPIVFLNNPDASATNSLLVIPAANNAATITTGSTFTTATLKFQNARHITFDGLNTGGSSLAVVNTQTSTGAAAAIWLASATSGNNNIGIRRLDISTVLTSSGKYGILAAVNSASPVVTAGPDNDNITVEGNTISNAYYGIYAAGSATVSAGGNDNWTVSGNTIGAAGANIGFRCVFISNAITPVVSGNTLGNIFPGASGASGIYLSTGVIGASVIQNTITNITCTVAASGTGAANGIYLGSNVQNTTVDRNYISGLTNTSASGYAARGIILTTAAGGTNNRISNNMISEISGTGDNTASFWPIGIALEGSTSGASVEFNSVHLGSSVAGLNTATASAAIYVNTSGSNNIIRNNILSNSYDNTSITNDVAYVVYSSASTASNISVMDHNDYFAGGSGNVPVLGFVSSTQLLNLPAMQSGFGGNMNSVNIQPSFVSSSDLHLVPSLNATLDNLGTPVAGVTADFDGQTRSATTPDIGADEFTSPTCTTAAGGTIASGTVALCDGAVLNISSGGTSSGVNTTYQWMQSSVPGGPYSPVSGGTGSNTPNYISPALSTGTLYFILQVSCSTVSMTATSNEATVVIHPVPTASASSNAPLCQGQTLNLGGASDIGSSYSWTGPASFSSALQSPSILNVQGSAAGVYTLVASTPNCSSAPALVSVQVNTVSAGITGPAMVCLGNSATLTATGNGTAFAWSNMASGSPIVLSPTASTVISLTATSAAGCTTTASHSISVTNPTITGSGALACGTPSASGTLSASAFGPVTWYNAPTSTVVVGTGNTFVTPAVSTNTTFYAESNTFSQDSLSTLVSGTSQFMGVMFDIVAVNSIEINNFDIHLNGTLQSTIEIWHRPGSFVGFETSNAGWTLAQTTTVTGNGVNQLTPIPGNLFVNVPAGQTHAFYIVSVGGGSIPRYTSNSSFPLGSVWTQNSDLQILSGKSGQNYFNVITSPRQVNCEVKYTLPGCTSPRIPVTLTVVPQPTVTVSSSSSTVCASSSLTLSANGASSYSWSNGMSGQSVVVSPSVTSTYTVTGDDSGCTNTAQVTVSVTPGPVVSLSATQTTVCVNGPAVTLSGFPMGGQYSGSNVSGNQFLPGNTAGAFASTYSYTDTATGCSSASSVTITVSTCTGIDAMGYGFEMSVFPNPNNGVFMVSAAESVDLVLTDLSGREVFRSAGSVAKTEIDIREFANGVYLLSVEGSTGKKIFRIIKQ